MKKSKIIFINIIRIICSIGIFLIIIFYAANKNFIENESMLKVITSMTFVLGIWQISDIFIPSMNTDAEEIKKQNEELKKEIREIKELIEKEPKEYKIDVKVIT